MECSVMKEIFVPNRVNIKSEHFAQVRNEMLTLGTPTLRACWLEFEQQWFAIEGSHRASAASSLGLPVAIIPVDWDDVIDDHDIEAFLERDCTVGEIIERLQYDGAIEINVDVLVLSSL